MKIPFHKPIFPEDLNQLLKKSTDSGWVTTGPKVKEFEIQLSELLCAEHIVAVSSGTAALHLALAVKGIGAGDKLPPPPAATLSFNFTWTGVGVDKVECEGTYIRMVAMNKN